MAALGWWELDRQQERADTAIQASGLQFLDEASRTFEADISSSLDLLASENLDLSERSLVLAGLQLAQKEAKLNVLNLFILDREGELVFPRISPPMEDSLPFNSPPPRSPPQARIINQAEWLAANHDITTATSILEDLLNDTALILAPSNSQSFLTVRLRAAFTLGTLLRKQGRLQSASVAFREAQNYAKKILSLRPQKQRAEVATAELMCQVAHAEIQSKLANSHSGLLDILLNISEGDHDFISDEMLTTVIDRLMNRIPEDSILRETATRALDTERWRMEGRRFAQEYQDSIAQTVRRRLLLMQTEGPIYQSYASRDTSSLIILRHATAAEKISITELKDPAWVGIRVDLSNLTQQALSGFLAGRGNFFLDVTDADGLPILPDRPVLETNADNPSRTTLAGLHMIAHPTNPEKILQNQTLSLRVRFIFLIALCLVAGGGAFFLLRSVSRETELAALKVEFVSRVSHELKTPLALIKMYGETLSMGRTKNPEQSVRFGGIVSREADRLTILINRILDFSRGNSGNIHYECRVIDLSALLRSVTDEYRPHLDLSHTPLTTTIQDGVTLKADPEALRSAIVNLLDNANKYTPESAADRRIEIEMTAGTAQATIEVRDRGIGIPITEQTRIFDAFFRASTAGEIRGAGLGLSMVRRFAKGHDGSIQALPRHGGGSIFRLILPIYLTPQTPSSRPDDIATSQQDPAQEIATLQKDSDHE